MPRKSVAKNLNKIFVLDTSVILYDFDAIYNFEEHDVAIPITVLEEVDTFKKGNSMINFHAREFIRNLDKLSDKNLMQNWIALDGPTHGRLKVLVDEASQVDSSKAFGTHKNDHRILNSAMRLAETETDRKVIMVTKDVNLRLKARALNLPAEDYETGKVKDVDHLYTGKVEVEVEDSEVLNRLYVNGEVEASEVMTGRPIANQYLTLTCGKVTALASYNAKTGKIELVAG